jgi:hypothetical protein
MTPMQMLLETAIAAAKETNDEPMIAILSMVLACKMLNLDRVLAPKMQTLVQDEIMPLVYAMHPDRNN